MPRKYDTENELRRLALDAVERELAELADILKTIRDGMVEINSSFEKLLADWDKDEDKREHADWEAIN